MPAFRLYPPRSPSGLDPTDREAFARRITAFRKAFLKQPATTRLGSLQVLELDQIRYRFGRRWVEVREKAFGLIEAALHRELGTNGLYVAAGETSLYLLRTSLTWGEADRRGSLLAADITGRLCGTVPGGVAVQIRTMPFDLDNGLAGIVTFEQLRSRIDAHGQALDDAELKLFLDHAPDFAAWFQPTVHLRKRLVSTYRLTGELIGGDGSRRPIASLCPRTLHGVFDAEHDNWAVQQAGQALNAQSGRQRAGLIVPVHYATLATMRFRESFMLSCRQLPPLSSHRLIFELLDLPPALPQGRVRELMGYLQPFCLTIVTRLGRGALFVEHLANSGVKGLSLGAEDLDPASPTTAETFARLVAGAKVLGLRTLIVGARSVPLCQAAFRAGIDHIAGSGLMPPVRQPGRVFSMRARG